MKVRFTLIVIVIFFTAIACVSAEDNLTSDNPNQDINITYDEVMWQENLTDINVELPENTSGNFTVKINSEVIYHEEITNTSFNVPVKLPKKSFEVVATRFPPIDSGTYQLSFYHNDVQLTAPKTLKVMKFSPDFTYLNRFPAEILKSDDSSALRLAIMFPTSANGFTEIYADDKLITKTRVTSSFIDFDSSKISNLSLGNHTVKILYYNDTYYHPVSITHNYEIVDALITIPDPINIGHDDCVSVKTTVESSVKVYIDSTLIASQKTEKGDFFISLEQYLKSDSREVKVIVSNNQFTRQKTQPVNVTYDFDVYPTNGFVYGEHNIIELYLPDTLNNNLLSVSINNQKYSFTHPSYIMNNIVELDISKLDAGNYTLVVSYPGDGRFSPLTKTVNFTVDYKINTPYHVEFKDGSVIYLNLPGDAKGNLNICINGELYKSVKLIKGHGEVKVDTLKPGIYTVNASYGGGDYNVGSTSFTLKTDPKITIDTYFRVCENKYITLEVPKDYTGVMTVVIGAKQYKVNVKNGKAVFSLKNLKIGEYDVDVEFTGEGGYTYSDYFYIEVVPAKIRIQAENCFALYGHKVKYKIKLFGKDAKVLKNVWVKFKIGKKTYNVKTNRKGIAAITLSKLSHKTHKIWISYKNVKVTRKISVRYLKLDVKKSKLKINLKATLYKKLKGKTVTFKAGKKTFRVKTNSKGVAKVSFGFIRPGMLNTGKIICSAVYMKDMVKTDVV